MFGYDNTPPRMNTGDVTPEKQTVLGQLKSQNAENEAVMGFMNMLLHGALESTTDETRKTEITILLRFGEIGDLCKRTADFCKQDCPLEVKKAALDALNAAHSALTNFLEIFETPENIKNEKEI